MSGGLGGGENEEREFTIKEEGARLWVGAKEEKGKM